MRDQISTYLLQTWDNGDFFVYKWTPFISGKGYRPLTAAEAEKYIKLQNSGKSNLSYLDEKELTENIEPSNKTIKLQVVDSDGKVVDNKDIEDIDDSETQKIIEGTAVIEASLNDEEDDRTLGEIMDIETGQETILEKELQFVKKCVHKTTLERHFLEKYQIELPSGDFMTTKAIANNMLSELADSNRLYLVDGEVKIK